VNPSSRPRGSIQTASSVCIAPVEDPPPDMPAVTLLQHYSLDYVLECCFCNLKMTY
jgi:hypothetical protein